VAQHLNSLGFNKVYALKGGWKAWEKAGYLTEPKWGSPPAGDVPPSGDGNK